MSDTMPSEDDKNEALPDDVTRFLIAIVEAHGGQLVVSDAALREVQRKTGLISRRVDDGILLRVVRPKA